MSQRAEQRSSGTIGEIVMFGVPVRFHFTFVFLLALLGTAALSRPKTLAADLLFVLALFGSILLHELGHAWTARAFAIRTVEIVMYPIGGVARLEKTGAPRQELAIALAGPAVNLILAGVLVLASRPIGEAAVRDLVSRIGVANLYLGLFNLLPAFPMDGGRALRGALAIARGEEEATRIATRLGRGIAALLALYGILQGELFLLLIAFLIFAAATQESAASQGRALTHGIPVRAAMITEFRTLPHGSTLRDAAELLLATSQQDFPVVHGEQVIGLLDRTSFVRGLAMEGADAYVSNVMDREYVTIGADVDLGESLPQMSEAGSCALVMEGERLVGLLTKENIAEFLMIRKLGLTPERAEAAERGSN